ncbi:MAG: hypothetical protein ACKOFW_00865 [Planctomycetaceae bacterium]
MSGCVLAWIGMCGLVFGQASEPELETGPRFRQALTQPLSVAWEQVDLRTICGRIQSAGHVALLLDRRIDPSVPVDFQSRETPLLELTQALIAERDARVVPVGNTLYLGPQAPAGRLRTLIALRQDELAALQKQGAPRRLQEPLGVSWNDLETPFDLVTQIARRARLKLTHADRIPHDLWAAAQLPSATPVEALSLILIQFDLTFAWRDEGRGIEVLEAPPEPLILRSHPAPRGTRVADWLKQIQARLPTRSARSDGPQVVVEATVEEHESLKSPAASLENGEGGETVSGTVPARGQGTPGTPLPGSTAKAPRPAGSGGKTTGSKPIAPGGATGKTVGAGTTREADDRHRYTLRLQDKPLLALLKTLERPEHGGWQFEYQADRLAAAGLGLERRISVEVREARLDVLLDKALVPAGLSWRRDGRRIIVEPQP